MPAPETPTVAPPSGGAPDAAAVVARLRAAGLTVATAESLTAGQVSARLADVPGASAVLRGGVVTYATDLKASLLGVETALLAEHGPVHPLVAAQMAAGVRRLLGADLGVATTGVAGPDPQGGQPVGTVFIALSSSSAPAPSSHPRPESEGLAQVVALYLPGDRAAVRSATTAAVLGLLADHLAHPAPAAGPLHPLDPSDPSDPGAGRRAEAPGAVPR